MPPAPPLRTVGRLPRRIVLGMVVALAVTGGGTFGFWLLSIRAGRPATPGDCLYMTLITITTVGYAEVVDVGHIPGGRLFTSAVLLAGTGTFLYLVSALTAFILEGDLGETRRRRKMQAQIDKLSSHYVVCGVGSTGVHIAEEFLLTNRPFVVIEQSPAAIENFVALAGPAGALHVAGDATEEHALRRAGVARAAGLIAALSTDKDNLYCVITARELNTGMRIVAKAIEPNAASKLLKAGATGVVETNRIGGQRMVSEMVRPQVVEFLDLMLRDRDRNLRVEEVDIVAGCPLDGRELRDADLRRHGAVLVVAVYDRALGKYEYAPGPEYRIVAGRSLILLGDVPTIAAIRAALGVR